MKTPFPETVPRMVNTDFEIGCLGLEVGHQGVSIAAISSANSLATSPLAACKKLLQHKEQSRTIKTMTISLKKHRHRVQNWNSLCIIKTQHYSSNSRVCSIHSSWKWTSGSNDESNNNMLQLANSNGFSSWSGYPEYWLCYSFQCHKTVFG